MKKRLVLMVLVLATFPILATGAELPIDISGIIMTDPITIERQTDGGRIVKVRYEKRMVNSGAILIFWSPFEEKRAIAIDPDAASFCNPIYLDMGAVKDTNKNWTVKEKPGAEDWIEVPSVLPQCDENRGTI